MIYDFKITRENEKHEISNAKALLEILRLKAEIVIIK